MAMNPARKTKARKQATGKPVTETTAVIQVEQAQGGPTQVEGLEAVRRVRTGGRKAKAMRAGKAAGVSPGMKGAKAARVILVPPGRSKLTPLLKAYFAKHP